MQRSLQARVLAGATIVALAGGSLVLLAPTAHAAELATSVASASASPTVLVGTNDQPAGDWALTALGAVEIGDTITVEVDDNGVDANCEAADDTLGFSAAPMLTLASPGDVVFGPGVVSSTAGDCTTATITNVVTYTATAGGDAGAVPTLTDIEYDVGLAVDPGAIRHRLGEAAFVATTPNAVVSNVEVTSGVPPTVLTHSGDNQPIPDIVLSELVPGAIDATGVCIALTGPSGVTFNTAAPAPVVTPSDGDGTVALQNTTPNLFGFLVDAPSTDTTTFTISGLRIDTATPAQGTVTATAGSCVDFDLFSAAEELATFAPGVVVTSGVPATLLSTTGDAQAIPNIVVSELSPGVIATALCVTLTGPAGALFDTDGAAPVVTPSNGDGTVDVVTREASVVGFTMDTVSTDATDFTISGLRLDTTGTVEGPVTATVGDCDDADAFSSFQQLAFFGTQNRTAGSDRYATAARIAFDEFDGEDRCLAGRTVVIARGDNFPDALAASYLAGSNDVPILLTAPTSVPPETVQALGHHGVTNVVLIGGTDAISAAVAGVFDNTPVLSCGDGTATGATLIVERVFGANRYVTAKAVAEKPGLDAAGTADLGVDGTDCDAVPTAIVASGENFPDALAAGGLAYGGLKGVEDADENSCGEGPIPLVLTHAATLSPEAAGAIDNLDIQQVIVVGGPDAVADSVLAAIDALPGVSVVRVAGADRQGTAAAISRVVGLDTQGDYDGTFLVARPDTFPDALAASSFGGRNGWPIFLAQSTSSLGTTTTDAILGYPNSDLFHTGKLLGGIEALTEAVAAQVATAIASQSGA